jgi:hypothetical protein
MAGLAQSLMDDPDFMFYENEKVDVTSYEKKIKLDLTSTVLLLDRPEDYTAGSYYSDFKYNLPEDFINEGNPQIASYTAWFDENNIKAMQFIFTNGKKQLKTPLFGSITQPDLSQKTMTLSTPVMSVQSSMINKYQPSGI